MALRTRKVFEAFEKRAPVPGSSKGPVDSGVCFFDTYPLDSDFTVGQRYPGLEQPGPGGKHPPSSLLIRYLLALKIFPKFKPSIIPCMLLYVDKTFQTPGVALSA